MPITPPLYISRRAVGLPRRTACLALAVFVLVVLALLVRFSIADAGSPVGQRVRVTEVYAPAKTNTPIAQRDVISTIQSVINYVINATVFFPARTFQDAVEKATRNIFSEQLDQFRDPLQQVVAVYAFQNGAVFGSLAIPGEVNAIGARLTEAAIPLWVLSLVLLCLGQLTRSAVGLGYGTAELAGEFARWLFIALASGNAVAIVNLVHTGFGALTYAIASQGGTINAGQFVAAFIPGAGDLQAWPILLLIVGCLLGLVIIIVMAVTYIARYTLLLAITGLAPICIAFEGIPFTRFVFRDWLSLFLRLELLQIINITVLIVFQALALGASGSPIAQALMRLAVMIGLASAIIGLNVSVFKQVFGVAIDAVVQMKAAAEQMVRLAGAVIGAVATGGVIAPALAGAGGGAAMSSAAAGSAVLPELTGETAGQAAAAGASGRAATALANALGGPASAFMRGYGDGASAGTDYAQRKGASAHLQEQQRAVETRRAEALAREMGATSADDIDAIAHSVTHPPHGYSDEQMMRAHRDNAGTLRALATQYGSPARAAAVAGYPSFGDLAVSMSQERLAEQAAHEQTMPMPVTSAVSTTMTQPAMGSDPPLVSMTAMLHAEPLTSQTASTISPQTSPAEAAPPQMAPVPAMLHDAPMSYTTPSSAMPLPPPESAMQPPAPQPTPIVTNGPSAYAPTPAPSGATSLANWAAQVPPTPIQQWISAPPHIGSPGEQFMLPYDFGAGAMLAHATDSSPTRAPLWAETAYHLRMAYGESYVQQLLQQAQSGHLNESQLMSAVEQRVSDVPSARIVPLFWKVGDTSAPGAGGSTSYSPPTDKGDGRRKSRRS